MVARQAMEDHLFINRIYISVYANLGSVGVSKGQKVGTGQTIGTVGRTGILQFQLRKETAKLNPEQWLR